MIAPEIREDVMAGVPDLVQAVPAHQAPRAYLRFGDPTSRRVIADARRGLAAGDCVATRVAADHLAVGHPDHDYVAYLAAWCEHVAGNERIAFFELQHLVATSDPALATVIPNELVGLLARDGTTTRVARAALVALGLWRVPTIDRYAEELFAALRTEDALAVVAENPTTTPRATELACRAIVGRCRRTARHAPEQLGACTRTSAAASATCEHWRSRGLLRAVLDWPGESGWDLRPVATPRVAELAIALRSTFPEYRDRFELVRLTAIYDTRIRDPAFWSDLATRAETLARTATDRAVVAPAIAVAEGARRNERALASRRCFL